MKHRTLAVALCAAVILSACGSRVDGALRKQVVSASLTKGASGGGGGGGSTDLGTDNGTTGDGTDAGAGTGTGTDTGGGGTSGGSAGGRAATGTGGGASGGGGAAAQAACKGGGASDVGVTPTDITLGNVADLSGPIPGLFASAPYGAQAYFAYINSIGGVCGRKLKLLGGDSQTDCTANQNAHSNLIPRVFAFVGSFALYDDCGTKTLLQNPDVPDLSYALGFDTKKNTTSNFPPQVAPVGYQNGPFCYWRDKFGDAVKSIGSIYGNIPASASSEAMIRHAAETCGWVWKDDIAVGATQNTFDAEMKKMQGDGVKIMFLIATTAQNAAEMKREADAQGFKPIWIIPIAYASDFVTRLGSAAQAEGIYGHNLYSMFFSAADAKNIQEVALFQKWMHNTHPDSALELYAMYSWAAAKLFVQTLKTLGPNPTRKAFMTAIRATHAYDAGGLVNGSDIGNHAPTNCYLLWQIHNGEYTRLDTPADHFRCDGTFVPYNP